LSLLVHPHTHGYDRDTLKGTAKHLRHLERNCNLSDPDEVLRFIASKENSNYKNILAGAYDLYAKYYKILWQRPAYAKSERRIHVPLQENVDYVTENRRSLKRKMVLYRT